MKWASLILIFGNAITAHAIWHTNGQYACWPEASYPRWTVASNQTAADVLFSTNLWVARQVQDWTNWYAPIGGSTNLRWYPYDTPTNRLPSNAVANVYAITSTVWIGNYSNLSVEGWYHPESYMIEPVLVNAPDLRALDVADAISIRNAILDAHYGTSNWFIHTPPYSFFRAEHLNLAAAKTYLLHLLDYVPRMPAEARDYDVWQWDGTWSNWYRIKYSAQYDGIYPAWTAETFAKYAGLPYQEIVTIQTGTVYGYQCGQMSVYEVPNQAHSVTNIVADFFDYNPPRQIAPHYRRVLTNQFTYLNVWAWPDATYWSWVPWFLPGSYWAGTNTLPTTYATTSYTSLVMVGYDYTTSAVPAVTSGWMRIVRCTGAATESLANWVFTNQYNSNTLFGVVVTNHAIADGFTMADYGWDGVRKALTNLYAFRGDYAEVHTYMKRQETTTSYYAYSPGEPTVHGPIGYIYTNGIFPYKVEAERSADTWPWTWDYYNAQLPERLDFTVQSAAFSYLSRRVSVHLAFDKYDTPMGLGRRIDYSSEAKYFRHEEWREGPTNTTIQSCAFDHANQHTWLKLYATNTLAPGETGASFEVALPEYPALGDLNSETWIFHDPDWDSYSVERKAISGIGAYILIEYDLHDR